MRLTFAAVPSRRPPVLATPTIRVPAMAANRAFCTSRVAGEASVDKRRQDEA